MNNRSSYGANCQPDEMLLPIEDAWAVLKRKALPLPAIEIPVDDAGHCYLAEAVHADRDMPAMDTCAVDGFAIHCEDTHHGSATLTVIESGASVTPGTCTPVCTGNKLPDGASAVVRYGAIRLNGDNSVHISEPVVRGNHVLKQSKFAKQSEPIISAGKRLGSCHLGLIRACGQATVHVHRRPTAGIIGYGKDLKNSSSNVGSHEQRYVNGTIMADYLKDARFDVTEQVLVDDDTTALKEAILKLYQHVDVIIVNGGLSPRDSTSLAPAILEAGGRIHFDGINIKPGRRQLFADLNDTLVFGVPGDILGCLVGFHEFALPALRILAGCSHKESRPEVRLPLMRSVEVGGTREHRVLVKLQNTKYGPGLIPVITSSATDIMAATKADGTARIRVGRTLVTAGQYVEFRPWGYGNFSNQRSQIGDQYVEAQP